MEFLKHRLEVLSPRRAPWVIALLALLFTAPSLSVGFVTDDHVFRLIFQNAPSLPELKIPLLDTFSFGKGEPGYNIQLMERGVVPWWTDPHWQLAFWRPIASATHWVDHTLFGMHAWAMHLHSILLYALLAFAATRLYQRHIAASWVAALAGMLYALDSAHVLPVGWLANRNAILSALFGVLVLLSHDTWRTMHKRSAAIVAHLMLVIALLCGEGSIAVAGYLFAYACFLDNAPLRSRVLTLVPYAGIIIAWRIVYSALGYGAIGSGLYTDPGQSPVMFLMHAVIYLPLLLYSHFAFPDPIAWSFAPAPMQWIYLGVAVTLLIAFAALLLPALRADRTARFYALGMVVSAIPSCATIPQYRLLLYAGIGGIGLIALYLANWRTYLGANPSARTLRYSKALATIWFLLHAVVSPVALSAGMLSVKMLGEAFDRIHASIPSDPEVVNDTVILVSTTGDLTYAIPPAMRSSLNQPMPRNIWPLYSGVHDLIVTRTSDRELTLVVKEGWLHRPWALLFRDAEDNRIPRGYQVTLSDMVVTVDQVNELGLPTQVRFTFDRPLDDPRLRWLTWGGGFFVPFEVPAVGDTRTLKGVGVQGIIREILGS